LTNAQASALQLKPSRNPLWRDLGVVTRLAIPVVLAELGWMFTTVVDKLGKVVAVLCVSETSDLMIITKDGKIIRLESSEIRQAGRSTQGVRLVRMEEGDQVAAASVIPESEEDLTPKNGELPLQ
jgi:hypothetical protein